MGDCQPGYSQQEPLLDTSNDNAFYTQTAMITRIEYDLIWGQGDSDVIFGDALNRLAFQQRPPKHHNGQHCPV